MTEARKRKNWLKPTKGKEVMKKEEMSPLLLQSFRVVVVDADGFADALFFHTITITYLL